METMINRFEELKNLRGEIMMVAFGLPTQSKEFKYLMDCLDLVDEELVKLDREIKALKKAEATKKPKCSAKMEFAKWEQFDSFDEVDGRYIEINIDITGTSEEDVELAFDKLADIMEDELEYYDFSFARCSSVEYDERAGKYLYGDTAIVLYEHGLATETKSDIKKAWKKAKKMVGVR